MKKVMILTLLMVAMFAVISCSKPNDDSQRQERPLYGIWTDCNSYVLTVSNDTIAYMIDEMDGIQFRTTYQKQDDNTLAFELPENGHGTLSLNPETHDLTMVLEWEEDSGSYNIPAYDHMDLATTAPNIAETLLFEEDLTTVADTLRMDNFYPIVDDKGDYACLLLPDGRKGWLPGNKTYLMRSRISPEFWEKRYIQEVQDLRGYHERTDSYVFNKKDNGKVGVIATSIFMDGSPAQEQYFIGELDGIKLNVTHRCDYTACENCDLQEASVLDKPFEIILVDGIVAPYIKVGKKIYNQENEED